MAKTQKNPEVIEEANKVYNYLSSPPPKMWDMNHSLRLDRRADGTYDFHKIAASYFWIRRQVEQAQAAGYFPVNGVIHTRFISNSDAYLSPINSDKGDLHAMVEMVSFNITPNWLAFFKKVEQYWLSIGGRPHWGKLIFQLPDRKVWGENGNGIQQFLNIKREMDPHCLFRSDFHYDIFHRRLPKLVNIRVGTVKYKGPMKTPPGTKYMLIIETATDRRESITFDKLDFNQTFYNISVSNFIQFQLIINGQAAGTAIWHMNLHTVIPGETLQEKIPLHHCWVSYTGNWGKINADITSINLYAPGYYQEKIAILGDPADTNEWVAKCSAAGFQVLVDKPVKGAYKTVTIAEAAKETRVVVFTCPVSELKDYIAKYGSLENRLVIDATRSNPIDSYFTDEHLENEITEHEHKIFGEHVPVARVVHHDNDILIAATDDGTYFAVEKWIKELGLNPKDIGYHSHHTTNVIIPSSRLKKIIQVHTTANPPAEGFVLPKRDRNRNNRRQQLEGVRNKYTYNFAYIPNCSLPDKYPLHENFLVSPNYLAHFLKGVGELNGRGLLNKIEVFSNKTLAGHVPFTVFSNSYFPSNKIIWCPDSALGLSRVGGLDPRTLIRVTKMDDIPDNFAIKLPEQIKRFGRVTDTVKRSTVDQGGKLGLTESEAENSLEDEIEKGNIYLVNYKILDMFEGKTKNGIPVVGAPLALFWWNQNQLHPVALQIFQKPDPVHNPVVVPFDGLKWQAAKVFFQNATAIHHLSCSHEYDHHLIAGSIGMATPRNLSTSHPLYALLYPHLKFTVSNAAAGFTKVRMELESKWYTGGNWGDISTTMSPQLVSKHAPNFRFYALAHDYDIKARHVDATPDGTFPPEGTYPFRDDGKLLWDAITAFIEQYTALYYQSDHDIVEDEELQAWFEELGSDNGGQVRGLLESGATKLTNIKDLNRVLSTILWIAGPHHAAHHFTQNDYSKDALHIHPFSTRKAWPLTEDELQLDAFKDILPTKSEAISTASNAPLGFVLNKFGDYHDFPLGKVSIATIAIEKFQNDLAAIEKEIDRRNKDRPIPYPYLKPSQIPNSVNI